MVTALDSEARMPDGGMGAFAEVRVGERAAGGSDEELMVAFGRGSVEAFEELFARYKQPIFGFFRRRVVDPAVAEELAQETFLVVIRGAARYEEKALFRTYLYAIGMKILVGYRRRAAFRATFLGGEREGQEASGRETLEADLWMRQAVGRLEPGEREILLLREFEQLSYGEIAEVLGLPVNTVRSRLFRARMALRERLMPAASGEQTKIKEGL